MAKFRKKPVVIDAVLWDGSAAAHVLIEEWVGDGIMADNREPDIPIVIPTLEGDMRAVVGDWIIRGIQGEVYPIKPNIFDATYEAVPDAPTA